MTGNMFTARIRYPIILMVLCVLLGTPRLSAQYRSNDFMNAVAYFESGDFSTALGLFKTLNSSQPGNRLVPFYRACCLVELNRDLEEAIEILYGMARGQGPDEAKLYLGKAYHRIYNFREAIRYYNEYELTLSRQEARRQNIRQMINSCRSGMELTATYNQYEVIAVTFLDMTDSAQYRQVRMPGGQLQRKPMVYFGPGEDSDGLNSLMFMPNGALRGDYLFFAGTTASEKDGLQLFRVRKRAGTTWGDPQEVKALNTEGNELLPYFDPIGEDLYYASDGGAGIGGLDLYKSHYDADRDEWSEPINLGFPVNSAMDEFLILPGKDLGMLMFFSNRQGTDSTVTVYRVHLIEPKKKTDPEDNRMLVTIASLGNAAGDILAQLEEVETSPGNRELVGEVSEGSDSGSREPGITRVRILSPESDETTSRPAQQEILSDALMHQAAADSLRDLATGARARVRQSEDPNDRWVWQKQIMVWEKKAVREEELADALFAMVHGEEPEPEARPVVNAPEKVVSAIVPEGEPGTPPVMSTPGPEQGMNRFDILAASPYNSSHPIPVNVARPQGVFYSIQLGAFGNPVLPDAFKGISPVTADTDPARGLFKYYAGKFSRYDDASLALSRVRSAGYEDAFVVAWYNGEPISTQRAKQLE